MADIQANIGIGVDTSQALAAIRDLQRQISAFHQSMAKGGALANAESLKMQQNLINTINASGKFSAGMARITSTTESFTNSLEKNKLSMGEYFRYAGGASKTFGKLFRSEFDTINKVARERVKDLQTQYIKMGRDANGALQAIKVRPLALDMDNLGTRVQMAAQKQQLFNQLLKQGTTNLLNFGKNTQWAGRQLMVGFTIPLTIFGTTAAREFQKLEEQAVKFRRVYGDMFTTSADTEKALSNIRELAEEFTKYGVAVEKTLGLAAQVAQMGSVGPDLMAQVTQATRLAVLGGIEQEEALNTTISLTSAFGVASEDLANSIAFLNAVENQTILSIEDFNEAIPKAGSVVKQLGGSVEDLAFFLTAMREGGINASESANALKSSLASIINPTDVSIRKLSEFGIDIVGLVDRNAGNLRGTVMSLAQELNSLGDLDRARAIEQLFGKFQFARISTLFQNITKDGTQARRVLELTANTTEELAIIAERELGKVENSVAFKFQKQLESLQAALAPIGEEFIKAVTPILEFATKILKSFNNLGDGAKQFMIILTAIGGVVAPAALMAFGLIANGVANLLKFFSFLGGAFGALSGKSTMLGGQTEYMTQQQLEAAAVAASLGQSHMQLTQIFSSEAAALRNLTAAYQSAISAQVGFRGAPGGGLTQPRTSGQKPKGFATGGIVRGPGTGTSDSIFAMLSNGEAVIPAEQVKKYGGVIKQIIADNVPGYAEGRPKSLSSIKDEVGMYRAPSAIKAQTTNMGWSGLEEEILAVQKAGRAVMEAQGVEARKVEARLKALAQKEASHILPTDVESYSVGDQTMEVKNWRAKNLTPDLGYVNNYVNQLEQSPSILEDFESNNLSQAAGALSLSMEEAKAEIDKLKRGIHPTSRQSAGMLKAIAESDTRTDPYRTAAVSAGIGSRLSGDFYETIGQRSYDPAKDVSAEKTQQLRLQNLQQKYSESLGENVEIKKIPKSDVIDPKEAKDLGASAGEGIVQGFKDSLQIASPSKRMFGLGKNAADSLADGFQQGMADETGKPPLPGNLAAPKPPVTPTPAVSGTGFGSRIAGFGKKVGSKAEDIFFKTGAGKKVANYFAETSGADITDSKGNVISTVGGAAPVRVVNQVEFDPALQNALETGTIQSENLSDKIEQQKSSTENLTKAQQRMSEEDAAALKESKRQGRQAMAGRAMAGLGTLSVAAGMATQVEGPIGEIARAVVGPLSALTGIIPALLAMPPLIGGLVAVLGAGVALWLLYNNTIKKAREESIKLSDAMGTGTSAIQKFADFAGQVSSTEIMNRRRLGAQTPFAVQGGKSSFGESFMGSEAGTQFVQDIQTSLQKVGRDSTLNKVYQQLGTAVASGAITALQAQSIAQALFGELEDSTFSLELNGKLLDLLGPNGNNLLENPLDVNVNLMLSQQESLDELLAQGPQTYVDGWEQANKDVADALANDGPLSMSYWSQMGNAWKTLFGLGVAEKNIERASELVIGYRDLLAGSQSAIDNLQISYEQKIEDALNVGDTGLAESLKQQLLQDQQEIINKQKETLAGFKTLFIENPKETVRGLKEALATVYSGEELERARQAFDDIDSNLSKIVGEEKVAELQFMLTSGTYSVDNIMNLVSNFADQPDVIEKVIRIGTDRSSADARQLADIVSLIQNPETAAGVITVFDESNMQEFSDNLQAYQAAANVGSLVPFEESDFLINLVYSNEGAANKIQADLDRLEERASQGPITNQFAIDLVGEEAFAAIAFMWDSLGEEEKKTALYSVITTLGVNFEDPEAESWLSNMQGFTFGGGKVGSEESAAAAIAERAVSSGTFAPTLGEEDGMGGDTSGGGASQSVDSLITKLRDLRLATIETKKGWEGMQQTLESIFAGGTKSINVFEGLSNQIRRMGVGESLIEMIVGMDPDEYNKRKNELFVFDKAGNIVGTTAKLKNMNSAFNAIAIGEYVNSQQSFIEKTKNQISAISILTSNGMSLAEAYQVVQDEALAAAIAMGATKAEIDEIIRITGLVRQNREEMERQQERSRISESVRKTNEEFRNQVAVLRQLSKEQGKYSDAQIQAIMGDSDLQKLFLDPSIDPKALQEALRNAEQKANLEVQIAIAQGKEIEPFEKFMSEVSDYFGKAEAVINVDFEVATADDSKIIEDAQNQISDIQYKLDDYNAELEQISWIEDDINEKYDKRSEALDEIAKTNDRIAKQQQAQLSIADALSRGDIASAARAVSELRSQQAEDAQQTQKDMLDKARETELAAVTGPSGMTREQLEEAITQLERQIFTLEEQTLEPAQERIRLAEIARDLAIEQLELNDMTRQTFEQIAAATRLADLDMENMVLSAEKLVALSEFIRTGERGANWEELFPSLTATASSGGSGGSGGGAPSTAAPAPSTTTQQQTSAATSLKNDAKSLDKQIAAANQKSATQITGAAEARQKAALVDAKRWTLRALQATTGSTSYKASGGMIIPKRMAMGGKVMKYAAGGLSMGSDIVPAMLTPGEFVVRRPAVSAFGVDNLEKINSGTYSDGSVYNYNLAVNVKSDADPNKIARTVMTQIKSIESQRIRGSNI